MDDNITEGGVVKSNIQEDNSKPNEEIDLPEPSVRKEREELATNICQLLIHCEQHNKICVTKVVGKGLWLPWIPFNEKSGVTPQKKIYELLQMVGLKSGDFQTYRMINKFLVESPQKTILIRETLLIVISEDPKREECCSDSWKYQWIDVKPQYTNDYFWGPEIQIWIRSQILNKEFDDEILSPWIEYTARDALKGLRKHPKVCKTDEQKLVRSAGFKSEDILQLYEVFLQLCYPSQYMSITSFKTLVRRMDLYLGENNCEKQCLSPTFRGFDCRQKGYLNFNELLSGLAAMDPSTEHGGDLLGTIRFIYIMRFYDSDSDGFLSHSDICGMIEDFSKLKDFAHKDVYKNNSTKDLAQKFIREHGTDSRISTAELIKAIDDSKIRGTSRLFRAMDSLSDNLKQYKNFLVEETSEENSNYSSVNLVRGNRYEDRCSKCEKINYGISRMKLTMEETGHVVKFKDMKDSHPTYSEEVLITSHIPYPSKLFRECAEMINRLREIDLILYRKHPTTDNKRLILPYFLYPSKKVLIKKILYICRKAKKVFEKEDRLLRVPSPCYVFGDIHSNFKDLMIFANHLWLSSPLLNDSNYLFLGDYVDRGLLGVHCVIFLFAHKLLAPNNFFLVRGNHEERGLQYRYGFFKECKKRFNLKVWKAINEVFDRLPVCALVEEKIFCSHGGIPQSIVDIEDFNEVPTVLRDPFDSVPVWEVLWSDPMEENEFQRLKAFEKVAANDMFAHNIKRATAYYFSEQAVKRFFEYNGLEFVIRAHECVDNGFNFQVKGQVITVFSSSLYCDAKNKAAAIFISQSKEIRVIRFQTF